MISFELGHVYALAGVSVMILEALPRLLPAMDADAVARLRTESERIGIGFKTAVVVNRIERADGRLRVIFTHDGDERAAEVDRVVNGAGRVANIDELDLATGRVEHDHGRVAVDDYLRSVSNPRVYAMLWRPRHSCRRLQPMKGGIVGRNIVDSAKHRPDYEGMATAVYTVPALAAVGLTEAAARQKGPAVDVHVNNMLGWFSAKTYAEAVAGSKIIVDRAIDRVVGAFCRPRRTGTDQCLRPRHQVRHYGVPTEDHVYAYPKFSADIKRMFAHA